MAVDLIVCGFNAHGQLRPGSTTDVTEPALLDLKNFAASSAPHHAGEVLFAGWSETVLKTASGLLRLRRDTSQVTCQESVQHLTASFGNHNGMLGALDVEGRLYLLEPTATGDNCDGDTLSLSLQSEAESPKIAHLALAGNDRVALTFVQAPNASLTHILEFASFQKFKTWFKDPSDAANYPDKHHMLRGRTKQLVANAAAFICLMDSGDAFTWGDARYQSLGRNVTGEGATAATEAGHVEALGGIKVVKVAAGGWTAAALSEDRSAYLLGSAFPGTEHSIKYVEDLEPGSVALVEIFDECSEEPVDILDVAVGDEHIVAVTEGGRVFAVGANWNGQCGHAGEGDFLDVFTEVRLPESYKGLGVQAGPQCTIIKAAS